MLAARKPRFDVLGSAVDKSIAATKRLYCAPAAVTGIENGVGDVMLEVSTVKVGLFRFG